METTVYISTPVDFRTTVRNWWEQLQLKAALQHIGLLIILMGYTVAGGLIFRHFEYQAEEDRIDKFTNNLTKIREKLIDLVLKNNTLTSDDLKRELHLYEENLQEAFDEGINIKLLDYPDQEQERKWTTFKAVFFSSTVLTTIGYGNIVPRTTEGQAFCIVFALVGIPLTLTVIADWGRLFASTVSTLAKHMPSLPFRARKNPVVAGRVSSYALSAVCFLFVYLAAGAGLFYTWEEDWSFFQGFYFCFITMTTIGFGDLVPKPKYMLICTLYILIGLALTSTIIELVRRQYAQSWRQLQALRGPLAENFRKFADNAPGLDVLAFQQDLMKVLTVVSMPRKTAINSNRDKQLKQKEWEEAIEAVIRDMTTNTVEQQKKQMVQIVIYETSV